MKDSGDNSIWQKNIYSGRNLGKSRKTWEDQKEPEADTEHVLVSRETKERLPY
jgi:hypothetical protein